MMTKMTRHTRFSMGVLSWAAALVLALGSDASPGDPGPLAAGGAGTSGTLPATAGTGIQGLPLPPYFSPYGGMLRKAAKPAASLTGLASELDDVLELAYSPDGSGWFVLTAPAPNGTRTITYYGNVVLELDRDAFLASQASADLQVDPLFNGGVASVAVSGLPRTTQVLHTGAQSLQLQRMIGAGLVERGITVRSFDKSRSRQASLGIVGQDDRIRIEQSH